MKDMTVKFCGLKFKNPVTCASGTFGSGIEYSEFVDLDRLGAVTTKGVSVSPWEGNATPRVAETPSGMMNAIGLQNPGVEVFIKRDLAFLKKYDVPVIVNVCGHSEEEYVEAVRILSEREEIAAFEINVSCPNVKEGGIAFGTDPKALSLITKAVKQVSKKPVIMKLSPNVTDIALMARSAEEAGADAISLINTFTAMKIDIYRRSFVLANRTGGLSGPAIHPIAVRMVYEASKAVKIPVIGMGGIASAEDAVEMMMAGASLVAVGMMNFHEPSLMTDMINDMAVYMEETGVERISDLIGCMH
ncbi:MAG: dihydroorotate dehydrogenase [Lachnospiraceae bacterium]|nr:dihydroorotate dehydrogenase [Lachnospiraceae bacterium]